MYSLNAEKIIEKEKIIIFKKSLKLLFTVKISEVKKSMESQLQSCVLNKDVKKRILVIDDNADTLILIRCVLEDICQWDVVMLQK